MQTTPTPLVLDYINRKLSYNPDTGIVSKGGKAIGTKSKTGHLQLSLNLDVRYQGCSLIYMTRAHQVAWYLAYGAWPDKWIDHIDGNGLNNRLSNLRLATPLQNSRNQRKQKRATTSLYKGVTLVKSRWRAYIHSGDKVVHLGYHPTQEQAALAYNAKALELYGEFARLNIIVSE